MMYASFNFIGSREVGEREVAALLESDVSALQSPSARVTTVTATEDDA